jgi:hypothetical protein
MTYLNLEGNLLRNIPFEAVMPLQKLQVNFAKCLQINIAISLILSESGLIPKFDNFSLGHKLFWWKTFFNIFKFGAKSNFNHSITIPTTKLWFIDLSQSQFKSIDPLG